jgi:tetratricopeptide (TPR) repeat protein
MRVPNWIHPTCQRRFAAIFLRAARRSVDRNDPRRACLLFRWASRLRPRSPVLGRAGELAMGLERYGLAMDKVHEAIACSPGRAPHRVRLGLIYLALGYFRSAREAADEALKIDPTSASAFLLLAAIDRAEDHDDAATDHIKTAIKHARSKSIASLAHRRLATLYSDQARREDAIASCVEAIELRADCASAYADLADAGYYLDPTHDHIAVMENLALARGVPREDKQHLHFALGKVYDRFGYCEQAFHHFRRANKYRHARFSARRNAKDTSRRIVAFTRERIATLSNAGSTSDAIIFIVGMPRSGTTLVEQLLDTHTQVKGLGERADILNVTWQLPARLAWTRLAYPECIKWLNADLVHELSESMLSAFRADADGAPRIATKRPGDFSELGLLHILFPHAKIIHCRRHPVDTCLSCFMQDFAQIPYSTRLHHLASHYQQYQRIMTHWYSVLPPGSIHEIDYEHLVSEPAEAVGRLLRLCALEHEPIYDTFFVNARRVDTASVWQVRQPIYLRSVGRWKKYRQHLSPLLKLAQSVTDREDARYANEPAHRIPSC